MGIGMLVITALIGLGVYLLVRSASGLSESKILHRPQEGPGAPRSSALDLLDTRYVAGELGRDEYLARREDLLGGR